jgi:hypothetical protein
MDPQTIINLAMGSALATVGWLARELWGAVKELRADLRKLEVDLPSNYIRKDEFQEGLREIKDICRQIFDKVDGLERRKADKS